MSARGVEELLARLYADEEFRLQFERQAEKAFQGFELSPEERESFRRMDTAGLSFASQSFAAKRAKRSGRRQNGGLLRRLLAALSRGRFSRGA